MEPKEEEEEVHFKEEPIDDDEPKDPLDLSQTSGESYVEDSLPSSAYNMLYPETIILEGNHTEEWSSSKVC